MLFRKTDATTERMEGLLEEYKDWLEKIEKDLLSLLKIKEKYRSEDEKYQIRCLKNLRNDLLSSIGELENRLAIPQYYFYNKNYFNADDPQDY